MDQQIRPYYDVVIMGGGPAGSTLAALLTMRSDLSVAVFEKEIFPREHIGESLNHTVVPTLEQSGALDKILESQCWVKKYGGIFAWDPTQPRIGLFEDYNHARDGVYRWSMHVNRAEFDHILLLHARDVGAMVHEGTSIGSFAPDADGFAVTLDDGREVRGRFFVDASGRHNSIVAQSRRSWLSGYKNVAIWQHYLGCRRADTFEHDWPNFGHFHDNSFSPIGSFAFEDGWCWFIPVPKIVDGERRTTHSIGIVTNPAVLRQPGKDFTDPDTFLRAVKHVPLLQELIQDAVPVRDKMLTATNYSMVNSRFASYEEHWILAGDSSYFVDPLFSSGVGFSMAHASAAALLIAATFEDGLASQVKRDLWRDYEEEWRGIATTFAVTIDQWYHAIGRNNPNSIYWNSRQASTDVDLHNESFEGLLNTALNPSLLVAMLGLPDNARAKEPSGKESPRSLLLGKLRAQEAGPNAVVIPSDRVAVRETLGLSVPGFKGVMPPPPFEPSPDVQAAVARYWSDPVGNAEALPSPHATPIACHRFFFVDDPDGPEIKSIEERDGGLALWKTVTGARWQYGDLRETLTPAQRLLLGRMLDTGMVTADRSEPFDGATPPSGAPPGL